MKQFQAQADLQEMRLTVLVLGNETMLDGLLAGLGCFGPNEEKDCRTL